MSSAEFSVIDMQYLANSVLHKGRGEGWAETDQAMRLAKMAQDAADVILGLSNTLHASERRIKVLEGALDRVGEEISKVRSPTP